MMNQNTISRIPEKM